MKEHGTCGTVDAQRTSSQNEVMLLKEANVHLSPVFKGPIMKEQPAMNRYQFRVNISWKDDDIDNKHIIGSAGR